jgi:hypothetical protein
VFDSNPDLEVQKNELKKMLDTAYLFCNEHYGFLNNKEGPNSKDFNIHPEYR